MIVSLDYSYAVDANYVSIGKKDNVFIVQADIYHMSFRRNDFDKIFCLEVLPHTLDARKSLMSLPAFLKKGGSLVSDVYRKDKGIKLLLKTKYRFRPFSRKMRPEILYG